MPDDRRMTTDRFYGGVGNRLANLRLMLEYITAEHPTREALTQWVIEHTRAGSEDAVSPHLAFLAAIDVITLSASEVELGEYGVRWLSDDDPVILYRALDQGVKGFDLLLESLADGAMTDTEIMELLVREFAEAEMSTPGPAVRHREWLQALGYVERDDGVNQLTEAVYNLLNTGETGQPESSVDPVADTPTKAEVAVERTQLADAVADEPQLTTPETEFTESRRRARDSAFAGLVGDVYDTSCAVCGCGRESPTGSPEVEAAHIYPKDLGGADDIRNGLALCKLHHWAFDAGWLAITNEYEILVADAPDKEGYYEFKQLEGQTLELPEDPEVRPEPLYLDAHRDAVFEA